MESLQQFGFCPGLRGEAPDPGNMDVLSLTELIHVPGIGLEGDTLQLALYGRDPPGAPFVSVVTMAVFEQEDGAVIDSRSLADFFQSFLDPPVQILGRQVNELGRDGRDQILKLNPGVG